MEFTKEEAAIVMRALLKFSRTAVKFSRTVVQQSEADIADRLYERIDEYRDDLIVKGTAE